VLVGRLPGRKNIERLFATPQASCCKSLTA